MKIILFSFFLTSSLSAQAHTGHEAEFSIYLHPDEGVLTFSSLLVVSLLLFFWCRRAK